MAIPRTHNVRLLASKKANTQNTQFLGYLKKDKLDTYCKTYIKIIKNEIVDHFQELQKYHFVNGMLKVIQ